MRPLRFVLTLVAFVVSFLFLLFVGPWRGSDTAEYAQDHGGLATYFNWRTPSSLFPPSAIISITDDNSTNFLARPAAFGPLLPQKSLSGQLWIGSGFGDDRLGNGAAELGCSDVPGWDDGTWSAVGGSGKKLSEGKSAATEGKNKRSAAAEDQDEGDEEHPNEDDGTDDHLHHPLPASDGMKTNGEPVRKTKKPTHADIQSLQESAEIAGKVVLLSRGGCGFLEKVKWVQRRGGSALIVGDDIRGGPLVTMYARGDTSNVTIPSLFTSHTTAQLLTSLLPSGSLSTEDATRLAFALGSKSKTTGESTKKAVVDQPNFTTTTATAKATASPKAKAGSKSSKKVATAADGKPEAPKHHGWFATLFGGVSDSADSRRPPSSGNIGWVLQAEFEDDVPSHGKQSSSPIASPKVPAKTKGPTDGFQIGIQDWRDPDLVAAQKELHLIGSTSTTTSSVAAPKPTTAATTSLRGGSITPGSGEYAKANHEAVDLSSSKKMMAKDAKSSQQGGEEEFNEDEYHGWLHKLFSTEGNVENAKVETVAIPARKAREPDMPHLKTETHRRPHVDHGPPMHQGLWVTLSPASMSSSPFFDTLLVLVVSPLVTLTVVYALLLLRSRIRRRRWRAPKSVVERLPVRTYQTMASSSASTTSSTASPASATTPLLPTTSRPINARARPRARTTSEVPLSLSVRSDDMASPSLEQIEEKRAAGLAEWRRRYGGKQRECVVCLEEYVDGVSRVMSLPCGHEFHAECITPWLTTRRRTCPICKGDVVRSLARSGGSGSTSPPRQQYRDHDGEDEEDVQEQAVTTVNDDPISQHPVSREDEAFEDLERGMAPTPDRTR
ncbi:hypothetical protein DOTSEDRAFT_75532 [Dothistroma septosporum NZE10]|uniref:RING-type E3 ubiquitin transferase n=1 Tax=Dothistroma septosporum (strain NZE10 / CBS 128990) TaxID=675120 RepID=M2YIS8_DOTSN|nr:hypothetical protein DOTSEDRAFT_75532 [Dothistroma septosporum NZE10]